VWCHLSESKNTLKLRRYSQGTFSEMAAEAEDIVDFVPLDDCMKLVSVASYSYKEADVWSKILQKLEIDGPPPPQGEERKKVTAQPGIIVPITELRQIYETLKLFDKATRQGLAESFSGAPASFERHWNRSRKVFAAYHNADDWGQGDRKDLPPPPLRLTNVSNTNEFTAFLGTRKQIGNNQLAFTLVGRELNPRRTRLGMFSNKLPATKSGAGGMDLLLRSVANGFPAVGEVKVNDDKDAFFALIQATTYAVELSTPSQLARLKAHFSKDFGELNVDQAKVEIAVLMVNPVDDPTLQPVLALLQKLNSRKKCAGLGQISLLQNEGDEWTVHS
jgi:hypothetical protein